MLVSVFIPTYNASKCIDATLQSVLLQSDFSRADAKEDVTLQIEKII